MPDFRKLSSEDLRTSAAQTGISSIRVIDDMDSRKRPKYEVVAVADQA
jgi:hypothetical protein